MTFSIVTIFPNMFDSYLGESILKRAKDKRLISFAFINPREYAKDKHKTVDDSPYGGGPGMVMKFMPIWKATESIKKKEKRKKTRTILFSTRGKSLTEKEIKRLVKYEHLILICGRYEGVDERVAREIADEEISIGNYILSGGELPAMVLIDAVSRHIPGVLGKRESLESIKGSYPVYTRPETIKIRGKKPMTVPSELLSGNHAKIEAWRKRGEKI